MKNKQIIIGGVSNKERLIFVKQLHAVTRAGYAMAQALDIAYAQSRGRLRQILEQVVQDVKNGAYLYEALSKYQKYFNTLFISLIKTGELSGSLQDNLERLVIIIEKDQEFKQKIRAAMMYPMFVLVAVVFLGTAITFFVLPNLLPLFGSLDVELPLSTKILLWFARAVEAYGAYIFFGFVGGVIFLIWFFKSRHSRFLAHGLLLKIPLLGRLIKQLAMARFGRSIASLSRSGMPIDESLTVTATILTNHYYQKVINASLPLIRKGQTLADALGKYPQFFDDIFIKLLSLGEATAGLEEACDHLADYFEGEVDETMKNLTVSLEPLLIIFVGIIVAFVAFSILGPIYKITGNIR